MTQQEKIQQLESIGLEAGLYNGQIIVTVPEPEDVSKYDAPEYANMTREELRAIQDEEYRKVYGDAPDFLSIFGSAK